MATTEAGERHLQMVRERAERSQADHDAQLLSEGLASLQVGDWVATTWQTAGYQRCGYVVGMVDATLDGEPARVDVFEARPRTDAVADGSREPCEACGQLPAGQWYGTSFRVPRADIVEVKKVTDWHRQMAARQIVRTVADTPGNRWTARHTRRLVMALGLVQGHEAS